MPNAGGQLVWVPEHGSGPTDAAGQGLSWPDLNRWSYKEARAYVAMYDWAWSGEGVKPIVIVLTVAHLNHTPEDCRPENLAAMCQRHHLMYDQIHHAQTAYATRKKAANTLDLFHAA